MALASEKTGKKRGKTRKIPKGIGLTRHLAQWLLVFSRSAVTEVVVPG
jgi:hypothetical protein